MQKFEDIIKNNGTQSLYEVAEEIGLGRNQLPASMPNFLPGRFYSLSIISPVPDLNERIVPQLNSGRRYYDINPIGLILFHDNWKEQVLILNLKVMSPSRSAKLLEAYYKVSSQNGLPNLFKEGKLLPLSQRALIDQRFYLYPPTVLSQMVGATNLNYAINKYNIDQIASAKLIDFDNFGKLVNPRIDRRYMFPENLNLAQVYEEFDINSTT